MTSQTNSNEAMDRPDETRTRRATLKAVLAGGGAIAASAALPARWTRPVVDSVLLPAHAAASLVGPFHYRGSNISFTSNLTDSWNPARSVLDTIIPPAMAVPDFTGDLCIESPDGTSFSATLLLEDYDSFYSYYQASGTVGGGAVEFQSVTFRCDVYSLWIEVTSVSANGANYNITGDVSSAGDLPVGSGCPSSPNNSAAVSRPACP